MFQKHVLKVLKVKVLILLHVNEMCQKAASSDRCVQKTNSDPEMKRDFLQRSEVKRLLLDFCASHLPSTDLCVHVTLIKTASSSSSSSPTGFTVMRLHFLSELLSDRLRRTLQATRRKVSVLTDTRSA